MATALNKHVCVGFQIQDAEGSQKSNAIIWTAFNDSFDFDVNPNVTELDQADNRAYPHSSYTTGVWFEGRYPLSFAPDAGTLAALIDWIQTRDVYQQGKFASVYRVHRDTGSVSASKDVKVGRARFEFRKSGPVMCSLDLIGKSEATAPGLSAPSPTGPYLWGEVGVSAGWGGGLISDTNFEALTIEIDNHVEPPADGMRITDDGFNPTRLYNDAGQTCSGSITRDNIVGSLLRTLWYSQVNNLYGSTYDSALTVVVGRGATGLTLTIPRFQIRTLRENPTGRRTGRIPQEIDWFALQNDALAAPITLS